jgi:hypothetical protein
MRLRCVRGRVSAAALALCAVAGGCGDDDGGGGSTVDASGEVDATPDGGSAGCDVSEAKRALVEELVHESLADLVFSTANTHPVERAFASQLVGVDQGFIGHVTLIGECAGPETFDPYCEIAAGGGPGEDPFYQDHDKCSRLACLAENVGTMTMYWTMRPETDPDARHVFTYATTSPPGEAVADPNPLLVWRYDLSSAGTVAVSADLDRSLVVTPEGDEAIDLGHTGRLTSSQVEDELTGAAFELDMPALLAGGATSIEIEIDAKGQGTGQARHGGATIASIDGSFAVDSPLSFTWCPDP